MIPSPEKWKEFKAYIDLLSSRERLVFLPPYIAFFEEQVVEKQKEVELAELNLEQKEAASRLTCEFDSNGNRTTVQYKQDKAIKDSIEEKKAVINAQLALLLARMRFNHCERLWISDRKITTLESDEIKSQIHNS